MFQHSLRIPVKLVLRTRWHFKVPGIILAVDLRPALWKYFVEDICGDLGTCDVGALMPGGASVNLGRMPSSKPGPVPAQVSPSKDIVQTSDFASNFPVWGRLMGVAGF